MSTDFVYDFCLDWNMNQVSKQYLILKFKRSGYGYTEFYTFATKNNWFTNSMYILMYADQFTEKENK